MAPTGSAHRERHIFNHDIMGCTADGVSGNHLYSGRVLGLSEPGDLVQLHPALASQWDAISAHYRRIGLSHTSEVLWDVNRARLAEYPALTPSVFFFGPDEHAVRPDQRWLDVVAAINSKNTFMELAHQLDVPVPRTTPFASVDDISEPDIVGTAFPCYLKAAVSVSGVGIHRCADTAALRAAIGQFAPGTPVQIQEEVATDVFLNLQYRCDSNGACRHAATEQVLDGFVHQGNRHPARHTPWESVEPMAQWLCEAGMRGVFAFDVAIVGDDEAPAFVAIECNPRYNGASYPTGVAHKLGIRNWLAKAYHTRHRSLEALDLTGLEYDPTVGTGIILVNWGPILVGKVLVLLAGDAAAQAELEQALLTRL
ncbi:ATP-grasp domain-containing protein [Thiohalocapsa sp.]|uniref:ATP-grasp domain-containing protein n=1 Tax=Thiohalocapsa sp. TaxID=2497641 RepID=UPI0025DCCEBD|nr:ATP-grasp domain-containing protein [Thiohalocapsa sp.]